MSKILDRLVRESEDALEAENEAFGDVLQEARRRAYELFGDFEAVSIRTLPHDPNISDLPPLIAFGEITTTNNPDGVLAEIDQRGGRAGHRGYAGAALVNSRTGTTEYRVLDPTGTRVVWSGSLGTVPVAARRTAQTREDWVRQQLLRLTGQQFRPHRASGPNPDLVPAPGYMPPGLQDPVAVPKRSDLPHRRGYRPNVPVIFDPNAPPVPADWPAPVTRPRRSRRARQHQRRAATTRPATRRRRRG